MTRCDLIHHPEAIRERKALLASCKADVAHYIAANGAAQPIHFTTPPKCFGHLAEVAWWLSQPRKDPRNAPDT